MKFSIRDLLWATALCAVVAAWHLDHKSLMNETGAKFRQWQTVIDQTKANAALDRLKLQTELLIEQKKVVALQDLREAQGPNASPANR
jgi:hypothetical protein